VTDDFQAWADAIASNKHIIGPDTGARYNIGTTLTLTSGEQVIEVFNNIRYDGPANTALFNVLGSSANNVKCYRTVAGNADNYCLEFSSGTSNLFEFNVTTNFLIHMAFIQRVGGKAAGDTLVENRVAFKTSFIKDSHSSSSTTCRGINIDNCVRDTYSTFPFNNKLISQDRSIR